MRHKIAALALILAFLAGGDDFTGYEEKAHADTAFSFSLFYNSLSPYGSWVPINGYGYGWYPSQAGYGWQPYVDGQWVWTDQGWTWASNEPWGWATYHYGRWIYDSYYGWTWIPGTVWAPAWVSWYQTPGYVGWSPLPPDNNFFIEIGIGFSNFGYGYGPYYGGYYGGYYDGYNDWGGHHGNKHHHKHDKGHYYDNDYYAPGEHCVFVPEDKFSNKNAKLVRVDGDRNLTVMRNVKNVTNIKVENNKIYNFGPDKSAVEKATGNKLRPVNLVDSDLSSLRAGRNGGSSADKGSYKVYRPEIQKKADETPFSGQNNVIERARNAQDRNGNGIDSGLSTGGKNNSGLVQDRTGRADNNSYGNRAPGDYGVIRNNTARQTGPAAPDYGKGRDYKGGNLTPGSDMSYPGGNSASTATNRRTNPYPGQPVYNSPGRIKSNTVVNDGLKNNRTYGPAPQQQKAVNRSPYNNYRTTETGPVNPYRNQGNAQTYKAPTVQPRSNYSANAYKAQTRQTPKYNYQPSQSQNQVQRQSKATSSRNKSTGSSGRSYTPPTQYTSPPMNSGVRNFNPGSMRSNGGNSFVRSSGNR